MSPFKIIISVNKSSTLSFNENRGARVSTKTKWKEPQRVNHSSIQLRASMRIEEQELPQKPNGKSFNKSIIHQNSFKLQREERS